MLLGDIKIEGPGVDATPEQVVESVRGEISKLATADPQRFLVNFPKGTSLIHPNFGGSTPVASLSVVFQLSTAGNLTTTEGLGVDPYLASFIYRLENGITNERTIIDASKLKLGFNTILVPGKFYNNTKPDLSYYCLNVSDIDPDMCVKLCYRTQRILIPNQRFLFTFIR
jgi:hypothetical protein